MHAYIHSALWACHHSFSSNICTWLDWAVMVFSPLAIVKHRNVRHKLHFGAWIDTHYGMAQLHP